MKESFIKYGFALTKEEKRDVHAYLRTTPFEPDKRLFEKQSRYHSLFLFHRRKPLGHIRFSEEDIIELSSTATRSFINENGHSPAVELLLQAKEIGETRRFFAGFKDISESAESMIEKLEEKGLVRKDGVYFEFTKKCLDKKPKIRLIEENK